MTIEATKFYIRYRVHPHDGDFPESPVIGWAEHGFRETNVETAKYFGFGDVKKIPDLGPTVGVMGYIGDVHEALRTLGKPLPAAVDYPEPLKAFRGRAITTSTLEELRSQPGRPLFVKPLEHKAFTGFVWNGDEDSRRRIVTLSDDTPVHLSEPVVFVAEYRAYILFDQVLDCRLYRGDWGLAPDCTVVRRAVEIMKKAGAPRAYCLDWGVTDDGRTLLVEMNDGFSFGPYGLAPVAFARMLSARWAEMAS